ncbi:MAG: hypothetical protein RBS49_00670 [Sphaerochaeta sp.]|jgi:hypothetical protein|nr:hypothetical protein [Sphaerochaeta sp.]MDX9914373.1 hypothetical protein [Sphaerochaeta sp.]
MKELRKEFEALPPDATDEQVRLTAENLARRQFMPTLILSVPNFTMMKRADMLAEFDRVATLDEESDELTAVVGLLHADEVKKKHLELLLYNYHLLSGLRVSDGDAWAFINELYEDD